jgi:arabinose-5-phosphate isomerase
MNEIIKTGKEVLKEEAKAILDLIPCINEKFKSALELIHSTSGMVIVIGVGKSGYVGRKISATLTSTGTRSIFLHPEEGIHGDLGIISGDDVCLMISHSGNTEEITRLIPFIKRTGAKIIAIASDEYSKIAKEADIFLNTHVKHEACPLNLAPTTSSTVTLALGDAIAIALLKMRDFNKKDFARFHPGGILGKKLFLRVEDIMFDKNQIVIAQVDTDIKAIMFGMTGKKSGFAAIVDDKQYILGLITDGDIRRTASKDPSLLNTKCGKIMNPNPILIKKEMLAVDALKLMKEKQISCLLVEEEKRIIGAIDVQEIARTGIKE